jgi:hypothetical protein
MKTLVTITFWFMVYPFYAQQTITSVASGDATNPFTWDCICIPQFSDHIVINHNVLLDSDWIINNGGSVTIGPTGSLLKDAQTRFILVDGGNSVFNNQGITELTSMAFLSNSSGQNTNTLRINNVLYVDTLATFTNSGGMNNIDSTLVTGTFINSGSFLFGSLWTAGTFQNTGYVTKDSLLNTGVLASSSGAIKAYDFATTGELNLTGDAYMVIENNFYNTRIINIDNGRDIRIGNDFFSGDSTFSTANITNNGLIEVTNNFLNIDTLQGTGTFCIGGVSTNTGRIIGTLDICSNSTSDFFNTNIGQLDPTVTNCQTGCLVAIKDVHAMTEIKVYPNPFEHQLHIEIDDELIHRVAIYSPFGPCVYNKQEGELSVIELSDLPSGTYILKVETDSKVFMRKIVK